MVRLNHYLYQYPHSKNFYFKLRIPQRIKQKYSLVNQFFISSLKTSDKNNAQRLALIVKGYFDKEFRSMFLRQTFTEMLEMHRATLAESEEVKTWDFRAYLKARFSEYLAWGKDMIASEMNLINNYPEVKHISSKEIDLFNQYLQSSMENNDISRGFELTAHKQYLLSYLDDYQAFTRSEEFRKANDEPEDKNLTLSHATSAEKAFSRSDRGVDYYQAHPSLLVEDEPNAIAVKRFIARHIALDFDFKCALVQELKKFEDSFKSFSDEAYDRNGLSFIQMKTFEHMFDTLNETLKTLKDFTEKQSIKEQESNALPIKPIAEKFMEEKGISTEADTVRQYKIAFTFLYTIIGEDFDLTQFNRQKALEIKDAVMAKQSNSEKGRRSETISVATINKYLKNFGAFLSWCYKHDYISEQGQFENMTIRETAKNTSRRRSYTRTEIETIVSYEPRDKREAKNIRDDIFWFPKIALYTGMRLNEISLLTIDDFQVQDGIDFINLNDKNLKTSSSNRVIPIHSKLIDMGLLAFVQAKRSKKEKILFSQIRVGKAESSKDGWAEPISKWFNRTLIRNIGIDKDKEASENTMIDFHSFRTTFISALKVKGVGGYLVKQIVGHLGADDITFDTYGGQASTKMSALKDLVEQIDY
ncbi:site-specific integrase [Shewanella vesiculosa]|uniref:Site-specific integrase n=1 Tax=Shewanella vesiculosa TaxID=518738 RepID=A0ABV0FN99_9GAMM